MQPTEKAKASVKKGIERDSMDAHVIRAELKRMEKRDLFELACRKK